MPKTKSIGRHFAHPTWLEKRFGPLTPEQKQQLHALETPTLLTLAERLWTAQSLEEVLKEGD